MFVQLPATRLLLPGLVLANVLVASACQRGTAMPVAASPSPATPSASAVATPAALGLWHLTGDVESLDFALTPLDRGANALADSFTVDVTKVTGRFFRLQELRFSNDQRLELDLTFRHPFPDATSRRDLHIFDLRVHALAPTALNRFANADGLAAPTGTAGASEPIRVADIPVVDQGKSGWSTWADEVVEPLIGSLSPNLYPHWRFTDTPTQSTFDSTSPSGWNVTPMSPTEHEVTVALDMTGRTKLDLRLALEASYGASAQGPFVTPLTDPGGRQNPRYFLPQFSLKEAWRATAVVSGELTVGASGTSATVNLTIFDHQGNRPASGAFDPLTAPQDALRYESTLANVTLSIPQLLGTPINKAGTTFTGSGSPSTPYTGSIVITGDQVSGVAGTYPALLAIRDSHPASTFSLSPFGTLGVDANLVAVERHDFALYVPVQIVANVSSNQAPTADVEATPTTVPHGSTTSLSPGPGTNDPDGSITLYEYDFDYDGTTFTVDASRATTAPVTSPVLNGPGSRTMAMRVTDNGAPALSAIDTIVITIQAPVNQPPNADLDVAPSTVNSGQTVQCSPGPGTNDPDGSIVLYEYDFDYDGVTFNIDAANATGVPVVTPPLTNGGAAPINRTIAMRVTDNGMPILQDIDTAQVTVNPVGANAPTWTEIHAMIANGPGLPGVPACIECHVDGPNGLFMTADKQQTYTNLVNVQSTCINQYIIPNSTANSFLYEKISSATPLCGIRMPYSGPPYWDGPSIQMVADWINDGAQNN